MDMLISTGKILFVIFFVVTTLVGVGLIAKRRSILGGTGLISLSLIMLLIVFWNKEFDKLGWTPLWILCGLLVLSVITWFVAPHINSTNSDSDDTE